MPGHVGVEPSERKCFDMMAFLKGFPLFLSPWALVSRHDKRCGSCNQTGGTTRQCCEVYNRCVAGWRENLVAGLKQLM